MAGLSLIVLAAFALFLWRGPRPMITGTDILLHGGASFTLVFLGNLALRKRRPPVPPSLVFAVALLIGISVEVVQFYLRVDFSAGDIVIDAIGGLAGWAAFALSYTNPRADA
jgi:hypothetical protein